MKLNPLKSISSKISSLPGLRRIYRKKAAKENEDINDPFVPGSPAYEKEIDRISSLLK